MPRLLIFAACQKLIVSTEDNTLSLISIIEGFDVAFHSEREADVLELPEHSTLPLHWYAVACWLREDGEEGVQYELRFSVVDPKGKILKEWPQAFAMDKVQHRVFAHFDHFPVSLMGRYLLNLSLRRLGDEEWRDVGSFPLSLTFKTDVAEANKGDAVKK